jgi:uncharacterized protein (TIGR03086 family)
VVPHSSGLELLEAAVIYALACAELATPRLLWRPTPCSRWDLGMLLDHVCDSIVVVHEAMGAGEVATRPAPGYPAQKADPVERLRGHAAGRLSTCTGATSSERLVPIEDLELTARTVAVTGAIEIAVHGWDISVACGDCWPIPTGLAPILLPIAPLFITPSYRLGLFADPIRLADPACPSDQLVAFLGRYPIHSKVDGHDHASA